MSDLVFPRRSFLTGLVSLITAPAVVRAEALMPIVVWRPTFHHAQSRWVPSASPSCLRKERPPRRRPRLAWTSAADHLDGNLNTNTTGTMINFR